MLTRSSYTDNLVKSSCMPAGLKTTCAFSNMKNKNTNSGSTTMHVNVFFRDLIVEIAKYCRVNCRLNSATNNKIYFFLNVYHLRFGIGSNNNNHRLHSHASAESTLIR